MSVASQLEQLETDITSAYSAINTKGGTIPAHKNTTNLATAINSISTGGGGSASDYFSTTPLADDYSAITLILELPNLDMTHRTHLLYFFDTLSLLETMPQLTNCDYITNASLMCVGCSSLVNVPYYYMPNCTNFSGAFIDSENLSNQSIENIMQMLIDCDNQNYEDWKFLENVIPHDICYKAENASNYQDFLNAGWRLYASE